MTKEEHRNREEIFSMQIYKSPLFLKDQKYTVVDLSHQARVVEKIDAP